MTVSICSFLTALNIRNANNKVWFRFIMFYDTFNNISVISWRSVLLVEETRVPGENHRAVARH
jgi:hypothetical protein